MVFRHSIAAATFIALGAPAPAANAQADTSADIPVIDRPVHLTNAGQYATPYQPVFRTTHDGRIGINFKQALRMYLLAPEKFDVNFHDSPNGPHLLAHGHRAFNNNAFFGAAAVRYGHLAICEPSSASGRIENPRACGDEDCYDLTLISAAWSDSSRTATRLYGIPATVYVSNPKTPQASIRTVQFETPVPGNTVFGNTRFFEPTVTRDGNLLVARIGGSPAIEWVDGNTGDVVRAQYNMVYLPAPKDPSRSCDVTQWDEMKPLGHAPYDTEINQTYGFALQPFRDAMGNTIPDRTDLAGTYPWIDSDGDNIGFATLNTVLTNDPFAVSCVPSAGCGGLGGNVPLQGKSVMGLWTNGKMVLMDNLVNNVDYSTVQTADTGHRQVAMFTPGTLNGAGDGLVRVGNGRDNGGPYGLFGWANNTTFLESSENKFNYWQNLVPVSPQDVVWHFSSGAGSDEFAFDDYLYANTFIASSMVQATSNNGNRIDQYNGINAPQTYVQNGATTQRWVVPSHGEVVNGRIERAAVGGLHGKGLWLSGDAHLEYTIASQPQDVRASDWHISLFVDARFGNDGVRRVLMRFPDGSELQLVGRNEIRYWRDDDIRTIALPQPIPDSGWAHLGVQLSNDNRSADFFYNGFLLDRFTHASALFEMTQGLFAAGNRPGGSIAGFRGWIDDLKVIAHRSDIETWCNHANGTLVGFDSMSGPLFDTAAGYPAFAHQEVTDALSASDSSTFARYLCYHDYSADYDAHRGNVPAGTVAVGPRLHFPEGPVVPDEPRPDSTANAFCLACHTQDGKQGLGLSALTRIAALDAIDDPRRQPSQPFPLIHGNIPANWLADGVPATHIIAPPGGLAIDTLLAAANSDTDNDGVPDTSDNCTDRPNAGQRDSNGDGFGNACDPDLDNDGVVNVVDLGLLRSAFFTGNEDADFDGDGVVNVVDLGVMRAMYFGPPGPSALQP